MSAADGSPQRRVRRGWPVAMVGIVVAMSAGMLWETWAFYRDLFDPWASMLCWVWGYGLAAIAAGLFVKIQADGEDEVFPMLPDFFLDRPVLTGFAVAGLASYPSVVLAWWLG